MKEQLDPPKQPWETVEYTDNPELPDVEHVTVVTQDFLPSPEDLVFREPESEKITIFLDKKTVAFFRGKAQELDASYQKMIRTLLREYVNRQTESNHTHTR